MKVKNNNKSMATLFAAVFMVGIGFSIIIPILPYYAESLGASAFQLGLLMTVYALCQFIFAPIWGGYSDRVGRKPLLIMGLLGFSLTFILFGLANSLWMLFAARIAGGALSCATIPAAMAYIGDSTTEEKRGASMGLMGASMGMGMIFGPAIGGMLSNISLAFPFFVAGGVALLNSLAVFFFVKESLLPEKRTKATRVSRAPLLDGLKTPLALLFITMWLASIAESTHHGVYALFVEAKLGLGAADIGWVFSAAGLMSVIVQGLIVGKAINRLGENRTAQIGLALMALSFILFMITFNFPGTIIAMAVFSSGIGLMRPAISSAVSKRTTMPQGMAMGILQGYDSLGRVIGPATGGFLLDLNLNLAYTTATIIAVLALITLGKRDSAPSKEQGEKEAYGGKSKKA